MQNHYHLKAEESDDPLTIWCLSRGTDMPKAAELAGRGTSNPTPAVWLQSQFAQPQASLEQILGECCGVNGTQTGAAIGGELRSLSNDAKLPLRA